MSNPFTDRLDCIAINASPVLICVSGGPFFVVGCCCVGRLTYSVTGLRPPAAGLRGPPPGTATGDHLWGPSCTTAGDRSRGPLPGTTSGDHSLGPPLGPGTTSGTAPGQAGSCPAVGGIRLPSSATSRSAGGRRWPERAAGRAGFRRQAPVIKCRRRSVDRRVCAFQRRRLSWSQPAAVGGGDGKWPS